MPQRSLVIGCDGTWNEPDQADDGNPAPTNVVKFMRGLAADGGRQLQHYEEGVGTGNWEALGGGIYGHGLDLRVLGAYRYLRKRFADAAYQPSDNRIFLLGFSRGAYTARRIAGLLNHSGVPVKAADCKLGWELYLRQDVDTATELKATGRFVDAQIEMVGVWDTVKATNDADYHDGRLSPNVKAGYHAMSIDERRKFFPILKWNRNARAKQVWFAGVHSNVGGGYSDPGLADIALAWMIVNAGKHGLKFKNSYTSKKINPNALGALTESYTGFWKTFGTAARRVNPTELVHPSVKKRIDDRDIDYTPRLPPNPNYGT